ncbi:Hypothetical protein FKW44_010107, partial [Caligus rogercresseyi]
MESLLQLGWRVRLPSENNRSSRSKSLGIIPCPLKVKEKTFSAFAADLWNSFPELRSAPTRGAAT